MTSGDVLSQWLQRQHGSVVRGPLVTLSPSGMLRVSETPSRPVRVVLPVVHGGQAAVARAVDQAGATLALRVQAVASDAEKARQMERLVSMITVAQAARDRPDRYPAVLPVLESFVLVVPGGDVSVTASGLEYELWCDLMTWCAHDLTGWAKAVPVASRQLGAVLRMFVPLLGTVHAVHQDLGILHRDITPNNVLVDEQGRLLLADWGIAHGLAAGQTSTNTQLVGNRGFSLPPEAVAGDPSVGRYTDAWYLGSLLAWMLTGQPPGPQHGPQWLPPGLPAGPVGDQVAAVVRGLCRLDPRGRMDLDQAQAVLTDAAAGRVSTNLTGSDSTGAELGGAAAVRLGATPGDAVPEPAPGPAAGDPASPGVASADGTSQPDVSESSSPPSDSAGDGPQGRPSRSAARWWVAAAVVAAVVIVGALWAATRLAGEDSPADAASSNPGRSTASAPSPASSDVAVAGSDGEEAGDDETAGDQAGGDGGATGGDGGATGGDAGLCIPAQQTCPVYSAARVQPILDALYQATGGTRFTEINLYERTVTATALTKPGDATFDDYYWSGGEVVGHHLTQVQPSADRLFDAATVDWSQAEKLANRLPELTGVDNPATVAVRVSLGSGNQVEFTASTRDDHYVPSVTADMNGNIKSMRGGKPGTPAAS